MEDKQRNYPRKTPKGRASGTDPARRAIDVPPRRLRGEIPSRSAAESVFVFDVFVDPGSGPELQVVLVLHQHVAIAVDSHLRKMHHLRIAPGVFYLLDELLAAVARRRPIRRSSPHVEVVAEHDQDRNLRERRKLRPSHRGARHFDGDDAFYSGRVDERGLFGKESGLGVAHENGPAQLHGQRRHVFPRWIRHGEGGVQIRNHLLVELVHGFDWELPVRKRRAERRPEAEHAPGCLMACREDVGQLVRAVVPPRTALKTLGSKPERARDD